VDAVADEEAAAGASSIRPKRADVLQDEQRIDERCHLRYEQPANYVAKELARRAVGKKRMCAPRVVGEQRMRRGI
jgi:hypothetical protein